MTHTYTLTKLQQDLLDAIPPTGTDWSVIRDYIAHRHNVKNWMTVRGHLQGLANAGLIVRENSTIVEVWKKNV